MIPAHSSRLLLFLSGKFPNVSAHLSKVATPVFDPTGFIGLLLGSGVSAHPKATGSSETRSRTTRTFKLRLLVRTCAQPANKGFAGSGAFARLVTKVLSEI